MSDIAYDWIALGVAAILFVILAFLKRKKNAGFTTRVLLATAFGIILGIAFNGHTDYVGAVGSIWSNAITALGFRCCCSASSPASRTLESPCA